MSIMRLVGEFSEILKPFSDIRPQVFDTASTLTMGFNVVDFDKSKADLKSRWALPKRFHRSSAAYSHTGASSKKDS